MIDRPEIRHLICRCDRLKDHLNHSLVFCRTCGDTGTVELVIATASGEMEILDSWRKTPPGIYAFAYKEKKGMFPTWEEIRFLRPFDHPSLELVAA